MTRIGVEVGGPAGALAFRIGRAVRLGPALSQELSATFTTMDSGDFAAVHRALKPALTSCARSLAVKTDKPAEYVLETRSPSPFPQHKGQPMFFASIRSGKAYVSFHLMPLYMCPPLNELISPALRKRMQGKTCFNFKQVPEPATVAELKRLAKACLDAWKERGWL